MAEAVSMKWFVAELESMLAPLGEQELRAAILAYATGMPAGARAGFLADLAAACAPRRCTTSDTADLITAIEAFTADVEKGMYYDGWGWDPDIHHERVFGDESWAPRIDELFSRAADAFLARRHDQSAEAYQRLFAASPAESLTTDLAEAGARSSRVQDGQNSANPGRSSTRSPNTAINRPLSRRAGKASGSPNTPMRTARAGPPTSGLHSPTVLPTWPIPNPQRACVSRHSRSPSRSPGSSPSIGPLRHTTRE